MLNNMYLSRKTKKEMWKKIIKFINEFEPTNRQLRYYIYQLVKNIININCLENDARKTEETIKLETKTLFKFIIIYMSSRDIYPLMCYMSDNYYNSEMENNRYYKTFPFYDKNHFLVSSVHRKTGNQFLIMVSCEPNSRNIIHSDMINCIHTAVTTIKPADFEDTINDDNFEENILKLRSSEGLKKIDLEPEEKFKAFNSWIAGIAESGLHSLQIQGEIEAYSHLNYPIASKIFNFLLNDTPNLIGEFLENIEKQCQFEGCLHKVSYIANCKLLMDKNDPIINQVEDCEMWEYIKIMLDNGLSFDEIPLEIYNTLNKRKSRYDGFIDYKNSHVKELNEKYKKELILNNNNLVDDVLFMHEKILSYSRENYESRLFEFENESEIHIFGISRKIYPFFIIMDESNKIINHQGNIGINEPKIHRIIIESKSNRYIKSVVNINYIADINNMEGIEHNKHVRSRVNNINEIKRDNESLIIIKIRDPLIEESINRILNNELLHIEIKRICEDEQLSKRIMNYVDLYSIKMNDDLELIYHHADIRRIKKIHQNMFSSNEEEIRVYINQQIEFKKKGHPYDKNV